MNLIIIHTHSSSRSFKSYDTIKEILEKYNANIKVRINSSSKIELNSKPFCEDKDIKNVVKALSEIIDDGQLYVSFKDLDCAEEDLFCFKSYYIEPNIAYEIIYGELYKEKVS